MGNQAGAGLGQGGPLPGERAHSRVRYCPAHYRKPRFRGAAGASGAAGVQEAPSWLNDVSERVCVRVTRASMPTALKIVCETVSGVWWYRRVRTLSANRRVTDALKVQTRSQCTSSANRRVTVQTRSQCTSSANRRVTDALKVPDSDALRIDAIAP